MAFFLSGLVTDHCFYVDAYRAENQAPNYFQQSSLLILILGMLGVLANQQTDPKFSAKTLGSVFSATIKVSHNLGLR